MRRCVTTGLFLLFLLALPLTVTAFAAGTLAGGQPYDAYPEFDANMSLGVASFTSYAFQPDPAKPLRWKEIKKTALTLDGKMDFSKICGKAGTLWLTNDSKTKTTPLKKPADIAALAPGAATYVRYEINAPGLKPDKPGKPRFNVPGFDAAEPYYSSLVNAKAVFATVTGLEYTPAYGADWKPFDGIIDVTAYKQEFWLRRAATDTNGPSPYIKISVPAMAAPPKLKVDVAKGMLIGKVGYEVRTHPMSPIYTMTEKVIKVGDTEIGGEPLYAPVSDGQGFIIRVPASEYKPASDWIIFFITTSELSERSNRKTSAEDFAPAAKGILLVTGGTPVEKWNTVKKKWVKAKKFTRQELSADGGVTVRLAGDKSRFASTSTSILKLEDKFDTTVGKDMTVLTIDGVPATYTSLAKENGFYPVTAVAGPAFQCYAFLETGQTKLSWKEIKNSDLTYDGYIDLSKALKREGRLIFTTKTKQTAATSLPDVSGGDYTVYDVPAPAVKPAAPRNPRFRDVRVYDTVMHHPILASFDDIPPGLEYTTANGRSWAPFDSGTEIVVRGYRQDFWLRAAATTTGPSPAVKFSVAGQPAPPVAKFNFAKGSLAGKIGYEIYYWHSNPDGTLITTFLTKKDIALGDTKIGGFDIPIYYDYYDYDILTRVPAKGAKPPSIWVSFSFAGYGRYSPPTPADFAFGPKETILVTGGSAVEKWDNVKNKWVKVKKLTKAEVTAGVTLRSAGWKVQARWPSKSVTMTLVDGVLEIDSGD